MSWLDIEHARFLADRAEPSPSDAATGTETAVEDSQQRPAAAAGDAHPAVGRTRVVS